MKNKARIVFIAVCISLALSITVFGNDRTTMFQVGRYANEATKTISKATVAAYKGFTVTQADIDYQKNINSLNENPYVDKNETDLEIVNRLISAKILLEVAESKGLSATEEEVNEMLTFLKESYNQYPEAAKTVNEYCQGAGITLEEYWEGLEEQAPRTITRQKVKDDFTQEYCKLNGLNVDSLSMDELAKIDSAYEEYRNSLLESHKEDVVYYSIP